MRERAFDPEVAPDWHPGPHDFLVNRSDEAPFFRNDPYRGVIIHPKPGMNVITGRVINNVTYDEPVAKRAMLVVESASFGRTTHTLVAWWSRYEFGLEKSDSGRYILLDIDLHEYPTSVLRMSDWTGEKKQRVRQEMLSFLTRLSYGAGGQGRFENLGYHDPYLAAASAGGGPSLTALMYRWYDDATVEPPLWGLSAGIIIGMPRADVYYAYSEVFERSLHASAVERAQSATEMPTEPAPTAEELVLPEVELAPRTAGMSEKRIRALKAQGLRPGYDFNGSYWVWPLAKRGDRVLSGEGPWGPYDFDTARTFGRIGAQKGAHDRIVTEGQNLNAVVRRYRAGTGARLVPNLRGGLAEGMSPTDFNPDELELGVYTELEHTDDPELALEIAMDHLVEYPDYYSRLQAAGL